MRAIGMGRAPILLLLVMLSPIVQAAWAQQPESFVVLLDCSGSVDANSRARALDLAAQFLDGRDSADYAVIAFAERVETVLDFGKGARLAGFHPDFVPQQPRTVLYDAIFEGSRILAQRRAARSAIFLFTDGRDVGSDLLLEDSIRICLEKGFSISSFGIGARIDEKVLRRISKLTGGTYIPLPKSAEVGSVLDDLKSQFPQIPPKAERPQPAPAQPTPAPPMAAITEKAEGESRHTVLIPSRWKPLLIGLCAIGLIAIVGLLIAKRRRAAVHCPTCGTVLDGFLSECPVCSRAQVATGEAQPRLPPESPEPESEPGFEEPPPLPESDYPDRKVLSDTLDTTVVMLETPVLIVKKGKNLGAVYPVPWCGVLNIGRSRSNNIVIEDRTASGRHCRLKHDGEKFFLYDLKSTNGTFINDRKVQQAYVKDGDTLQVGETHFLFKVQRLSA